MQEVYEYKLLVESDAQKLSVLVNQKLKNGWRLYGSPFAIGTSVAQAIIK